MTQADIEVFRRGLAAWAGQTLRTTAALFLAIGAIAAGFGWLLAPRAEAWVVEVAAAALAARDASAAAEIAAAIASVKALEAQEARAWEIQSRLNAAGEARLSGLDRLAADHARAIRDHETAIETLRLQIRTR